MADYYELLQEIENLSEHLDAANADAVTYANALSDLVNSIIRRDIRAFVKAFRHARKVLQ